MDAAPSLLIIGAGPFGLAAAAYADHHGIPYRVVGAPLGFWRENMPAGMLLRSTCDWHLDPMGIDTIDAYLASTGRKCAAVEPLSLEFYLGYADWFLRRKGIRPEPRFVRRLDREGDGFVATFEEGPTIRARNVLVAVGMRAYRHCPADVTDGLPPDSYAHTCDFIDMASLRGRRCLIVGGRQSAFEWAALLREAGTEEIHVCHRHDTPAFAPSDWSWVAPLVDRTAADGGWYRRLPDEEKQAIVDRMWQEGRAKLEPWLKPRIDHDTVRLWPNTRIHECERTASGALRVRVDNGREIEVDRILLATGYDVDMRRIRFLRDGNLWDGLALDDGHPRLDESMQTSHEGLYITGQPAVRDFGPFLGFTVSVRASAERIGRALSGRHEPSAIPSDRRVQ